MSSSAARVRGFVPLLAIALGLSFPATAQIQVFSTGGYVTPETISLAPSGFGAYGGSYFIPDASTGNIWILPATGGPPAAFLTPPTGVSVIGGIFLPSGWGPDSGKFVVAAATSAEQTAALLRFDSDGNRNPVAAGDGIFSTPMISPANFGIWVATSSSPMSTMASGGSLPPDDSLKPFYLDRSFATGPFGLEFAPSGWGAFGNRMLVSDSYTSNPDDLARKRAISSPSPRTETRAASSRPCRSRRSEERPEADANGPERLFPDSLGIPGRLLLVSVSGSPNGLGYLGELLALDATGTIVAHLQVGSILAKFDPRGML